MVAKVDVRDVALFFIALAQDAGELLTHMKLQKLIYYAQAWHLGNFGEPLFEGRFEAWTHGPVCPEIYHEYKQYQNKEISYPNQDVCDSATGCLSDIAAKLPEEICGFLNSIADDYMNFTAYQLRAMSHKENPWMEASKGQDEITVDSMLRYYSELVIEEKELAEIEAAHRAIQSGNGVEWTPGMFS